MLKTNNLNHLTVCKQISSLKIKSQINYSQTNLMHKNLISVLNNPQGFDPTKHWATTIKNEGKDK